MIVVNLKIKRVFQLILIIDLAIIASKKLKIVLSKKNI